MVRGWAGNETVEIEFSADSAHRWRLNGAECSTVAGCIDLDLNFSPSTNLLPIPALDGGRILVVAIEWLRRRPFDRNAELTVQRWGLVALLALAAVISFVDIQRIWTGAFTGVH